MRKFTIYTMVMLNAVFTLTADDFKFPPVIARMHLTTAVVKQCEISLIGNNKEFTYAIIPGTVKILKDNNIINFNINCGEGSNIKIIFTNPEPEQEGIIIKGIWTVNGQVADNAFITILNSSEESFDIKYEIISIEALPNAKIAGHEFHIGITLNYLGY